MIIKEMAYPVSFKMNEFKKITSYAGRVRYCNERLPKIGAGSARIAYKIDEVKVLKLAKNSLGIQQNIVESEPFKQNYPICARVFDHLESGEWLEMELATSSKASDFKRLLGISFDQFREYVQYDKHRKEKYITSLTKEEVKKLQNTEFFINLSSLIHDYDMPIGDFIRKSSWGVVKRGGKETLVLIDFGYDSEAYGQQMKKLQKHFGR